MSDLLRELETLLLARRRLGERLLSADAYERWGKPSAREQALTAHWQSAHAQLTQQLVELVERTRRDDLAIIANWAALHVAYLDGLEPATRAAEHVIMTERQGWEAVAAGAKAFVDENVHYVKIDPARYEAIFGFEPLA